MHNFYQWVIKLPQKTWPFHIDGFTYKHKFFWWRQVWHFFTGVLFALVATILSLWLPMRWVFASVGGIFMFVTFLRELETNQTWMKTALDIVFFFLGFFVVTMVSQ